MPRLSRGSVLVLFAVTLAYDFGRRTQYRSFTVHSARSTLGSQRKLVQCRRGPVKRQLVPVTCSKETLKAEAPASRISWSLPWFLMGLTAVHKCVTDGLSRYTRTMGQYDATTAAFFGEVVKVPVLAVAVLVFEGRSRFWPVLRSAVRDSPFELVFCGLLYSIHNILYYEALSHVSVATYQILSQSKLLFTGLFMTTLLQRKLTVKQLGALVLLVFGTILTQWSEVPQSAQVGGHPLYGGLLVVLGALLSAWPNVYYEKVLKSEGKKEEWAKNIQVTFWIWFWLLVISMRSLPQALGSMSSGTMLTGFTGFVWLVVFLQSFKCVLIPATLKWGDNIIYAYAKPFSILLTVAVTSLFLQGTSLLFCVGAAIVLLSMWLYGA